MVSLQGVVDPADIECCRPSESVIQVGRVFSPISGNDIPLLSYHLSAEGNAEAQLLSFVWSTGGKGSKPRSWNLQNLGDVLVHLYSGTGTEVLVTYGTASGRKNRKMTKQLLGF